MKEKPEKETELKREVRVEDLPQQEEELAPERAERAQGGAYDMYRKKPQD